MEIFEPGMSALTDIQPFLFPGSHFVYCPSCTPKVQCPEFETFFLILQTEGFVYNIKVFFISFVVCVFNLQTKEGVLVFPQSNLIFENTLGIFTVFNNANKPMHFFEKLVTFLTKKKWKNNKTKYHLKDFNSEFSSFYKNEINL